MDLYAQLEALTARLAAVEAERDAERATAERAMARADLGIDDDDDAALMIQRWKASTQPDQRPALRDWLKAEGQTRLPKSLRVAYPQLLTATPAAAPAAPPTQPKPRPPWQAPPAPQAPPGAGTVSPSAPLAVAGTGADALLSLAKL